MRAAKPEMEPQTRSVAGVPVRIFVPETVDAVYLHIHGGGFAIGEAAMNDVSNAEIARTCRFAVVSVDYRLAPEHPYPAGPDDCETVARWLVESSESEFGTSKLFIGGESAGGEPGGGHLAHGCATGSVRSTGSSVPTSSTGYTTWRGRRALAARGRLARPQAFRHGSVRQALPGERTSESRLAPDVSPLYADLSGLPPALFTVGGADPLLDDSLFMAARWQVAGNDSELAFYPECPHGFDMFPTKAALKARARQMQWMAAQVRTGITAGSAAAVAV